MSVQRSASVIMTPLLLRNAARTSLRVRPRQPLSSSSSHPALALLIARRPMSTETSTSSGNNSNFPPPGFNSEQAKKPLQQQDKQKEQAKEAQDAEGAEAQGSKSTTSEHLTLSGSPEAAMTQPTEHPKTDAAEARTLNELATEKAAADKEEQKKKEEKKKENQKLTVWQRVKKEANHYWDGTKLLATEARISFKLAVKMAAGYELTRREHRQLHRTVKDLGRLVPFSVFVIVPFAEFLLPVALRLFPNLLPSTYEGQKSKDTKATNLRSTRKEVSNFLRQTLKETGLPLSAANAQREEFTEFFRKVRSTGETPSASDVIKVCKIFKDDLTLDNLSRPQLVAITRYMNLNTFGTDAMLRYQVRHRMRQIKRDDKAIAFEGVDSLSIPELQSAAAGRGLRTHGADPQRLRDDLRMWLDLRLKYGVPSTLLILSNAFVYAQGKDSELATQIDALQAVLASVPEELFHEIELEVHTAEGAATNKQRLDVLKEQQKLIQEENQQDQENEVSSRGNPKDDEDIDNEETDQGDSQGEAQVQAQESKSETEEKKA